MTHFQVKKTHLFYSKVLTEHKSCVKSVHVMANTCAKRVKPSTANRRNIYLPGRVEEMGKQMAEEDAQEEGRRPNFSKFLVSLIINERKRRVPAKA